MSNAPEISDRFGSLPEPGEWWHFTGTYCEYPCIGRISAVREADGTYEIDLENVWADSAWPSEDTVPLDDLDYLVQEVGDVLSFACQGDACLEEVTSACLRDIQAAT